MARPINANANETKEKLRGAASELFANQGVGSTSVRQIAEKAGVNIALVSHYFGGKEGLYSDCVDAMYVELGSLKEILLSELSPVRTPARVIEKAVIEGFRFGRAHRSALQLIMRDILDRGELPQHRTETVLLPFLETLPSLLQAHLPRTEEELRWSLQSLVFIIVRYSLSSESELRTLSGTTKDPLNEVETHLVKMAYSLLGITETEKTHE